MPSKSASALALCARLVSSLARVFLSLQPSLFALKSQKAMAFLLSPMAALEHQVTWLKLSQQAQARSCSAVCFQVLLNLQGKSKTVKNNTVVWPLVRRKILGAVAFQRAWLLKAKLRK
ncbi:hypothetical protein D3C72_1530220 [compost metagenome]